MPERHADRMLPGRCTMVPLQSDQVNGQVDLPYETWQPIGQYIRINNPYDRILQYTEISQGNFLVTSDFLR